MTLRVILNPTAGSASANQRLRERLESNDRVELVITRRSGHARKLANQAALEGCSEVLAAGGDGTVNEVINGLDGHFSEVTLGVVPLGTGNDAARTLGLPLDAERAWELYQSGLEARSVNMLAATSGDERRYLLNHVNGGYGHLVNEEITAELKEQLGPLAYLKGAAEPFASTDAWETHVEWADGSVDVVDLINILIANGRTIAGGFPVAPDASLEDGTMFVILLRSGTIPALLGAAARLLVGEHPESDLVIARATTGIEVESSPPMEFMVDGEEFGNETLEVRVARERLTVFVGPDYETVSEFEPADLDD